MKTENNWKRNHKTDLETDGFFLQVFVVQLAISFTLAGRLRGKADSDLYRSSIYWHQPWIVTLEDNST